MTFAHIPIEKIHVHENNVRFTATADEGLVASIRSLGVQQPVMVAPHPTIAGEYRLIDGHRRFDGARQAGLTQIEAVIREDLVTDLAKRSTNAPPPGTGSSPPATSPPTSTTP